MKRTFFLSFIRLFVSLLFLVITTKVQAQFWTEDFGNGCDKGDTANLASTINGTWLETTQGTNGNAAHRWFISATSAISTSATNCAQSCQTLAANTNKTLHISNQGINVPPPIGVTIPADSGGIFVPGGYSAFGIDVSTEKRIESPTINCTGHSNITIQFDYFEGGVDPQQNATLEYFDGTAWFTIFDMPKTNNGVCSGGIGNWDVSPNIALPASANNNPNVKIGFKWQNNNAATPGNLTPSIAIDNITLSSTVTPPPNLPNPNFFVITSTTICDGGTVSFQDNSQFADSLVWSFPGGTPATDTGKSPVITYNTPGVYNVTLTAYNVNGQADTTAIGLITVNNCTGAPVANFTASQTTICRGDSIDFTDLSTGFPTKWGWFFPGATNINFDSTQNPVNIVYDTVGTFEVTLVVENAGGQDFLTRTNYIKVLPCPKPVANFTAQQDTVCVNDIVTFINQSKVADSTRWIFNGADSVNLNNKAKPFVIYETPGFYSVTQIVSNQYGTDNLTKTNYILVLPYPNIEAGVDQFIYTGEKTILSADGDLENYYWEPNESLSCDFCKSPQAFPLETTTYTVYNYYENEAQCITSDTIRLVVEKAFYAGIPDIFSPNLDNNNDRLFVMGNGIYRSDLTIYDRFGTKIFEYTPEIPYWDGTIKGRQAEPGVYTYVANIVFIDGSTEFLKGQIKLVR